MRGDECNGKKCPASGEPAFARWASTRQAIDQPVSAEALPDQRLSPSSFGVTPWRGWPDENDLAPRAPEVPWSASRTNVTPETTPITFTRERIMLDASRRIVAARFEILARVLSDPPLTRSLHDRSWPIAGFGLRLELYSAQQQHWNLTAT